MVIHLSCENVQNCIVLFMISNTIHTSVDLIQYTFPLVFHTRICDAAYNGIIMAIHKHNTNH